MFLKKAYWFVIITYLVMQLSSFIGVPIFIHIGEALGTPIDGLRIIGLCLLVHFQFLSSLTHRIIFLKT